MKEINQLHKRTCFAPLKVKEMKHSKRKKAQMALMFLTEKRDKSVKGRMCTMPKRQAVVIFPEVNYELSLVM
jgi:hypothetical protein